MLLGSYCNKIYKFMINNNTPYFDHKFIYLNLFCIK